MGGGTTTTEALPEIWCSPAHLAASQWKDPFHILNFIDMKCYLGHDVEMGANLNLWLQVWSWWVQLRLKPTHHVVKIVSVLICFPMSENQYNDFKYAEVTCQQYPQTFLKVNVLAIFYYSQNSSKAMTLKFCNHAHCFSLSSLQNSRMHERAKQTISCQLDNDSRSIWTPPSLTGIWESCQPPMLNHLDTETCSTIGHGM